MPSRSGSAVQDIYNRTAARLKRLTPLTVEERFEGFKLTGYRPYGLYLPEDSDLRKDISDRLRKLRRIPEEDERNNRYELLQRETAALEASGEPGRWQGQMAVAKSPSRFRIVAFGRRTGKTRHAAEEMIVVVVMRPRSVGWVCAVNDTTVSRCFDILIERILDLELEVATLHNAKNDRLIIFGNGSRVEGVSLDRQHNAAGASVNFAIVDETAFVEESDWERKVLPPLTDTGGQAILLSSWEGEGNFFYQKAEAARAEMHAAVLKGQEAPPLWEFFRDETWNNFFVYPGGYDDPKILEARKELKLSPKEFLEQFGAIPSGVRGRVYGEFNERVHVGSFPFRPELEVTLVVDPSSGANPYAVGAIQRDGQFNYLVDEIYETGVACEDLFPIIRRKPWVDRVRDVIVDPAWPAEIDRWNKPVTEGGLGFRAFGLPHKPRVEERIPVYRRLLRDADKFEAFRRRKLVKSMEGRGIKEEFGNLDEELQIELELLLEEELSDERVTEEDIEELRKCAYFFIDKGCVHAIKEHRLYSYLRRKGLVAPAYREKPRETWNHLMDGIGYYAWFTYRFEGPKGVSDYSYLKAGFAKSMKDMQAALDEERDLPPAGPVERAHSFTLWMRGRHKPQRVMDPGKAYARY